MENHCEHAPISIHGRCLECTMQVFHSKHLSPKCPCQGCSRTARR